MLKFCGGNIERCLHWAMNLNTMDVVIYLIGFFVIFFIILRIYYWITQDFDIW